MTAALRAGAQVLRRQGRDGVRDLALTAVGVALPVALVVVLAGVLAGLDAREERTAWRTPSPARDGKGTFVIQRSGDAHEGEPITRVDLAPASEASPPRPLGLTDFPGPGEVFVSPALLDLVTAEPDGHLLGRWPGPIAGTVSDEALARPDELLVVVGHPEGGLAAGPTTVASAATMTQLLDPTDAVLADRFTTVAPATHGLAVMIGHLSVVGAVLLLVPALQLSAAAARFTTNRRAMRLAALRLAGATPGQVLTIAAFEAVVASTAGALAGVALAAALVGPLSLVPLAGGTWFPGDLWPGLGTALVLAAGVVCLGTAAVLVTLRRAASAPLGVITGQRRARPTAWRLLASAALWTGFVLCVAHAPGSDGTVALAVGTGAVIASLAVVGPWLTWVLGALAVRFARRTPMLLAGRRLQSDPIGAFRPVGGIVLVGFLAGLVLTVLPMVDRPGTDAGSRTALVLTATPTGGGPETDAWPESRRAQAAARLGDLALEPVEVTDDGLVAVVATLDVEAARTALDGIVPGRHALTERDRAWEERTLVGDLGRAAGVATLTMVLLAVLATALAASSDLLEQRPTLRALHLAGTDTSVLQRARDWQATLPLGVATVVSVASGAATGLLLLVAFERNTLPGVPLAALIALVLAGPAAGLLASRLTRPLLRTVTAA